MITAYRRVDQENSGEIFNALKNVKKGRG